MFSAIEDVNKEVFSPDHLPAFISLFPLAALFHYNLRDWCPFILGREECECFVTLFKILHRLQLLHYYNDVLPRQMRTILVENDQNFQLIHRMLFCSLLGLYRHCRVKPPDEERKSEITYLLAGKDYGNLGRHLKQWLLKETNAAFFTCLLREYIVDCLDEFYPIVLTTADVFRKDVVKMMDAMRCKLYGGDDEWSSMKISIPGIKTQTILPLKMRFEKVSIFFSAQDKKFLPSLRSEILGNNYDFLKNITLEHCHALGESDLLEGDIFHCIDDFEKYIFMRHFFHYYRWYKLAYIGKLPAELCVRQELALDRKFGEDRYKNCTDIFYCLSCLEPKAGVIDFCDPFSLKYAKHEGSKNLTWNMKEQCLMCMNHPNLRDLRLAQVYRKPSQHLLISETLAMRYKEGEDEEKTTKSYTDKLGCFTNTLIRVNMRGKVCILPDSKRYIICCKCASFCRYYGSKGTCGFCDEKEKHEESFYCITCNRMKPWKDIDVYPLWDKKEKTVEIFYRCLKHKEHEPGILPKERFLKE